MMLAESSAAGQDPAAGGAAPSPHPAPAEPEAAIDLARVTERTQLRLPDGLDLTAWAELGQQILALSDLSSWWIGDWLVFGQDHYRDRYKFAITETSLDYQTLRNYAWVARRFAPGRRRPDLTFQHHMEVAALSDDEQDHWLGFAHRLSWSRNELRKQIRASAEVGGAELEEVRLQLEVTAERREAWETAAARQDRSLSVWMFTVLDGAVRR